MQIQVAYISNIVIREWYHLLLPIFIIFGIFVDLNNKIDLLHLWYLNRLLFQECLLHLTNLLLQQIQLDCYSIAKTKTLNVLLNVNQHFNKPKETFKETFLTTFYFIYFNDILQYKICTKHRACCTHIHLVMKSSCIISRETFSIMCKNLFDSGKYIKLKAS